VIGSIELYLAIQDKLNKELASSKNYYVLSIDIYKILSLNRANRHCEATAFLDDHYNEYIKLVNGSNVREEYINDYLIEIKITEPEEIVQETVPTHSFPNY
jgi:hypothetical protein